MLNTPPWDNKNFLNFEESINQKVKNGNTISVEIWFEREINGQYQGFFE